MPVQHVPTLLVMKPISVTEIVSMATEVLIITDTPTARAAEEHAWLIHIYVSLHTHTRARARKDTDTHISANTRHEEEHATHDRLTKTSLLHVAAVSLSSSVQSVCSATLTVAGGLISDAKLT